MSLVRCRECTKEISTEADACPHCGCRKPVPMRTERPGARSAAILTTVAVVITLGILSSAGFLSASNPPAIPTIAPASAPAQPTTQPLHPDVVKAREAVDKLNDDLFCRTLGKALRSAKNSNIDYQAAMIRRAENREGVTHEMLAGIRGRMPVIGMNACAVIAALGQPERSNRSVRSGGEHYQLVYPNRTYIYLDNGVVTSWQD